MSLTTTLTLQDVTSAADPATLLDFAWAMEPSLRLAERTAALERLQDVLEDPLLPAAPAGRDWQLELWAERAVDAAAAEAREEALELADRVLAVTRGSATIATARATLARGRALAWQGTEESTRAGEGLLVEAAERFAALHHLEWQGCALFWRGHAVCFANGRLREAEALQAEALAVLPDSSPRRALILGFYAEVLVDLGEFDRADRALDEAYRLAETANDATGRAYVTWTRAHVAAGRTDAVRAERLFREVERDATDWWRNRGAYFLCDAARTLDTLGLTEQAHGYLRHAQTTLAGAPVGTVPPSEAFEPLLLTRALLIARSGDPVQALEALQGLVRERWLEQRLVWRLSLLGAWASLRAGDREAAGAGAARAFATAVEMGGITVATATEPDISAALAPLAAEAGSLDASALLAGGVRLVISLFGTLRVASAQGVELELPAGKPGELVRMLALHPHGLPVDVVLEEFFPDTAPKTSRHRLRQILTRLRAAAGDVVIRDGEMLTLAEAWVDVREFRSLTRRARASRGTRALILREAALALAGRGPLLVGDPYATWTEEIREDVQSDLHFLEAAAGRGR